MKTHDIRQRFLQHFVGRGHTEVPSAPLVIDDPTLLFVNAGMVPFKPYFLGQQTPPFSTATSIQKCVRTLDIDEVGITTRHNTFFQMAGNFSFGDYFKEGAMVHAWTLLTQSVEDGGYGFDPDKLWVTVYLDDDEAYSLWRDVVGVRSDHIQRRGMKDNYWSMGVPGPCGPSSEIFYDRGPEYGADGGPEADEDRYIEIWNLVFMEKERGEGSGKDGYDIIGTLPRKNIDTGMGIERVAFLLQGVENVYETDLLRPTIDTVSQLTGKTYDSKGTDKESVYFRVIADHARTAVMLISDGVVPSNEGGGYILRRLLRRIIRSARLLGAQDAVMPQLVNTVIHSMSPSFPELAERKDHLLHVCSKEEKVFLRTLDAGLKLFTAEAQRITQQGDTVIPGSVAFSLHDTHGFPIDLTREMAADIGMTVDDDAFYALMSEQRQRAQADAQAKKSGHADLRQYREFIDHHPTDYVGYETLTSESTILGMFIEGKRVSSVSEGDVVDIVLDRSPFYAESGGQCADQGYIVTDSGRVHITDVQKMGKTVWRHHGTVEAGVVTEGKATASVDETYHRHAMQAHTATHLLHAALHRVLGPSAIQAGSLNKPGYLRFDVQWDHAISSNELRQLENDVNDVIDRNLPVTTESMSYEEAISAGALALFGENYGDTVRVVTIGAGDEVVSKELCGGNHVTSTALIGPVRIISEGGVAAGTRRIEALVGPAAIAAAQEDSAIVTALSRRLKCTPSQIDERFTALTQSLKEAEKRLADLTAAAAQQATQNIASQAVTCGDATVLIATAPTGTEAKTLRTMATDLRGQLGTSRPVIVALFAECQGRVPVVIALNPQAEAAGFRAGDLIRACAEPIAARGGGKPALAQGAGTEPSGIPAAQEAIRATIETQQES